MNKQDNKLALSVVATLISGIALIYTLIMYRNIIFAVVGMSALFLIIAYILTQNIIAFITIRNKSMNVQLKNMIDDLSSQLEIMGSSQAQIGKATYLYTKQAAKTLTTLEGTYTESQEALYRNLASLSSAQNKAAKLMIKYNQNNTMKLIATVKEVRNQLSETMIQGFDQLQPNNEEIIDTLQTIVNYLKSQPSGTDQTMGLQLNNVAHELQNISNSIRNVQFSSHNTETVEPVIPSMPVQPEASPVEEVLEHQEEPVADIPEEQQNEVVKEILVEQQVEVGEEIPTEQEIEAVEDIPVEQQSEVAEEIPVEQQSEVVEEIPIEDNEEPFTPTFTVVGKSVEEESYENTSTEEEPESVTSVSDDPNKQLSPDEIAALFAAADPAPKKTVKPVEEPAEEIAEEMISEEPAASEPIAVTPVSDDPNKQLSPDEIAALFAAADPAPKKPEKTVAETPSEPVNPTPVAEVSEEPASITPVSDDPNKQLSPEEIAALFAQMG
ncbi:MAG: hypothetical protein PUC12_17025 [Clostridiales bacterium]|nr:hypothetical protein [Clostridiales bacterium]